MRTKLIFIILLFCSCTHNNFSGYVYDYDSEEPIENVYIDINGAITHTDRSGYFFMKINSNSTCTVLLKKEGYANKKIYRKADSSEEFMTRNLKDKRIYLFTKESDFSNKN